LGCNNALNLTFTRPASLRVWVKSLYKASTLNIVSVLDRYSLSPLDLVKEINGNFGAIMHHQNRATETVIAAQHEIPVQQFSRFLQQCHPQL
jgi:hypothetical protein